MSAADRTDEDVDPAIPLDDAETAEWIGRPRWTVVVPAVVVGAGLVLAGGIGATIGETPLALGLVPVGLGVALVRYLVTEQTQYVVTDRALYVKRGVLSRSVTRATHGSVQNSSYAQDVTGSLFGYGSVEFEIAGGSDLGFRAIDRPQEIRALVDRATDGDGIAGPSGRSSTVPGNLEQWEAIRGEVRRVRQTLEQ